MIKKIGVITFARSEYSSLKPVLKELIRQPDFETQLFVSGMHLSPIYGESIKVIESDGFEITARIPMAITEDSPNGVCSSLGELIANLSDEFVKHRPDLILMVGDRYELLAAASSALIHKIPIAHISGGDNTEGAIDNQIRHAVTKMSHLHFVSMSEHAQRVLQMGEEPWRVHITGDPALDDLRQGVQLGKPDLERRLGFHLESPLLLVTYHPTTLAATSPAFEVECLLSALEKINATMVITSPNADVGNHVIIDKIKGFCLDHPHAHYVQNLGPNFYNFLSVADAMVGNSSSGIWEAPSFRLPSVNIGDRQKGRLRVKNVIDSPLDSNAIYDSVRKALSADFRNNLDDLVNPYGDGHASERIIRILNAHRNTTDLLAKRFVINTQ